MQITFLKGAATVFCTACAIVEMTPARAQAQSQMACPPNYALTGSLCVGLVTGDVVQALPGRPQVEARSARCPIGYAKIDALCFDPATGDVEMARSDGTIDQAAK